MSIAMKHDRVGWASNDDRRVGQGLLSPKGGEADSNNRAAVEMTHLWKSQNESHRGLEISHRTRDSHIPTSRFLLVREKKTKNVE